MKPKFSIREYLRLESIRSSKENWQYNQKKKSFDNDLVMSIYIHNVEMGRVCNQPIDLIHLSVFQPYLLIVANIYILKATSQNCDKMYVYILNLLLYRLNTSRCFTITRSISVSIQIETNIHT